MQPLRPQALGENKFERRRQACQLRIGAAGRHRFRRAKVRHHPFQPEAGAGVKTPQQGSGFRGNLVRRPRALPAATCRYRFPDEPRDWQPASPRRRGCLQQVKLPGLPNHRSQPLVDDRLCFPGQIPDINRMRGCGTDGAHRCALLGSGDPQPLRSRAGQQWGACQHIMAVGVRLDHRHQISLGARRMAQLLIVGQQPLAGDFRPDRSGEHAG